MDPYLIVLADDHVMIRQGLRKLLESKSSLKVIGEVSDGVELLSFLSSLTPHLVIVDVSMPNLRGIEAVRVIKKNFPQVKVLILTMHREYLHQTLAAGADGYLLKEEADRELFAAVEDLQQDKKYISPGLREMAANDVVSMPLSSREIEVLRLIASGRSSNEVGEILSLSGRTVEAHRASIMRKLGLKSTASLVKYAIERGYV